MSTSVRVTTRLAALLTLVASLVTVALPTQEAEAQNSYDQEMIRLVNDFRTSNGRTALISSASLSSGSLAWSQRMASGAQNCTTLPNTYGHDLPWINNPDSNDPPGTSLKSENIQFACGSPGQQFPVTWSYGGIPDYCTSRMDYTAPAFQVCARINSASHRTTILNSNYTHFGSGTVIVETNGGTNVFATQRFTRSSVTAATTCNGQTVTVNMALGETPTNGNDVILGTNGAETIDALGGNDVICALGGGDTIFGRSGNDVIFAGAGNDQVFGGIGDDEIEGNGGSDTIEGNSGSDRIRGGSGNDTIDGGDSKDWLYGDNGADVIRGGSGYDKLFGGNGDDEIYGENGNDKLKGGYGDDDLFGGAGKDKLKGGAHDDAMNGGAKHDICNGGNDTDTETNCEDISNVP